MNKWREEQHQISMANCAFLPRFDQQKDGRAGGWATFSTRRCRWLTVYKRGRKSRISREHLEGKLGKKPREKPEETWTDPSMEAEQEESCDIIFGDLLVSCGMIGSSIMALYQL